ncbi:MAG: asparagine synthase C-terminal domain-containing protein, partial [Parvularculaceae bacterium]|nr:asparagine synthase C-terminal domain-containing protein [Parvularculaceae bacterium]
EPGGKTNRYFEKTRDGKLILRRMMERYIPQQVATREKQGFSAPDASWFKGESIDYVKRRIMTPGARIWNYLDRATVETLVSDHFDGRVNRRLLIWSLLNLEQWCEEFL